MRNKIVVFGFVLFFITNTSVGQTKQYIYYFDKDLNSTEQPKSIFNGIGVKEDSLFKLTLFNVATKQLVLTEHFTDSSLQVSDGRFQSFYKNVSLELEGNYLKGKEEGLWQRWDSLGHVIDSSIYDNGEKVMVATFGYHKNFVLDSFVISNIKSNQLTKIYYDDSGKVVSEVSFTGQNGFEKIYKNGIVLRADSVFTRDEIEASFPGGAAAWTRYIVRQIQSRIGEFGDRDYGTCLVKFIVGIDGKVSEVEATTMKGTKLAEVSVYAVREGPNWEPAMQYGRPVRAYRIQPVTLTNPSR